MADHNYRERSGCHDCPYWSGFCFEECWLTGVAYDDHDQGRPVGPDASPYGICDEHPAVKDKDPGEDLYQAEQRFIEAVKND